MEETKKQGITGRVTVIVAGFAVLTLVIFFTWDLIKSEQDQCGKPISYNGQDYNFKTGSELLNIEFSNKTEAVKGLSEILTFFLEQARLKCEQYKAGQLSDHEYQKGIDDLGIRFGDLVTLQKNTPAQNVGPLTLGVYSEALVDLRNPDRPPPLGFNYIVYSGDRVLTSGDTLRSGDHFRLEIELPETAYLYVVMLDSDHHVSRLYPAPKTGLENPVKGLVRIPKEETDSFELDNKTGIEKILIFVQRQKSISLENQLPPIGSEPSTRGSESLDMAIKTRGAFVSKSQSTSGDYNKVISRIGKAAASFLIDHR